jgi:hypothetical protein
VNAIVGADGQHAATTSETPAAESSNELHEGLSH